MRVERFADVASDIMPLWRDNYEEVEHDQAAVPLDPDWGKYATLDQGGHLVIVTARQDGELAGYIIAVTDTHIHHRGSRFAMLDITCLRPPNRGGRNAYRMMQAMEAELRRRGVVKVVGSTRLEIDNARLFEALGWRETERVFTKLLGT